jgi:membrane protease YdiL (CAAX protease family)
LLIVGFAEETLFRGYILNSLLRLDVPKIVAIAVSSAMFGAWHFIGSGNWAQVLITAIAGSVFAVTFVYGKKRGVGLLSIALAHGAYDLLLQVLAHIF